MLHFTTNNFGFPAAGYPSVSQGYCSPYNPIRRMASGLALFLISWPGWSFPNQKLGDFAIDPFWDNSIFNPGS